MKAAHFKITSPCDEYEESLIEMIVSLIDGVKDVAPIRTMRMVSVLYDEHTANPMQILRAIHRAGFAAETYSQSRRGTLVPAA